MNIFSNIHNKIENELIESLIESCKNYLHNPSEEFFIERKLNVKDLINESGKDNLLIVNIKSLNGKRDVVGSKVLKVYDYINNKLKENDFKILKDGWDFNEESVLYYIIKAEKFSEYVIHDGPPLEHKKHVEAFKKKHKNHKNKKGKLYVELKREIETLKDFTKKFSNDEYIKSNVKKFEFKIL